MTPLQLRRSAGLVLLGGCVALLPVAADAQVLRRPPRSTEGLFGGATGPVDPNRTRTEFALTFDLMGGYDDNLSPEGGVPTDPTAPQESGMIGLGAAHMRFWRGRTSRSIEVTARSSVNTYQIQDVNPLIGADASITGHTSLGADTQLTVSAGGGYRPSFRLTAFGPIEPVVDSGVITDPDPGRGVTELESVATDATAALSHSWSTRQTTSVDYSFSRNRFDDTEGGLDGHGQTLSTNHSWAFARNVSLRGSFGFQRQTMEDAFGLNRPMRNQVGEVGVEYRKPFSATRRLVLTGGGGATRVQSVRTTDGEEYDFVAPSGFGSVRFDFGRTWALSGDYRRGANVLEGITPQTFFSDAASLTLGGSISRDLSTTISAAYSAGGSRGGETGRYAGLSGTAQLQYAVSRCCALVGSYSYYEHRMHDVATIPGGFPARFERNSIRVGMTIWLPLYGAFEPASGVGRN